MRVIYFSKDYTSHDHRILSALSETDPEVHFLRLQRSQRIQEYRALPDSIGTIDWIGGSEANPAFEEPKYASDLKRVIEEIKPDLIHAGPVQSCAYLTALTNFTPLLTMSWGYDILRDAQEGNGRKIAEFTLSRSSLLACDCEAVASAANDLGMPRDKMVIFPWGVDLNHFSPGSAEELRAKLGWQDAFIILSTRALTPIYGVDILVEGFIQAAKLRADLRLLILHDGILREDLERKLREANLEDRAHFVGRVGFDRLPAYYRAADLYLSASRSDGSSISLLEAMASGLAALVSNIPGNCEWVELEKSGWWFEDGQSHSLAKAIAIAVKDESILKAYGENAREIAVLRANWDVNFQLLVHAYQSLSAANVKVA